MVGFVVGFIIGLLSFPMIYCLSPRAVVEVNRKKMLRISNKSKGIEINDEQMKTVVKSMHRCKDTHWVNAVLQRLYFEISRSYAIETRIKSMILKRFEVSGIGKYFKSIDIVEVALGKEAPYVESIQVVSDDDVCKIISEEGHKCADSEEEKLFHLEEEIKRGLGLGDEILREECGYGGSDESFGHEEVERIGEAIKASTGDCKKCIPEASENSIESSLTSQDREANRMMFSQKIFERLQVLLGINYGGGAQISLSLGLPKGIVLKTTIFINGMKGDVLVRIPSKDYDTRYEYCFLFKPELAITVESGISGEIGKLYFRKSISNFIERYIRHLVSRTMVYPAWSGQYLPFIVPPIKDVVHKIEKVTLENHSIQLPQIVEGILLYSSMDYKIVDVDGEMVHRRAGNFINERERILCTHFPIPKISLKATQSVGKNRLFKGLTLQESKVMNQLYSWTAFSDVISRFRELRVKTVLTPNSSLVELVFENTKYEFVRVVVKNGLIFQRNDPESPEFIVFKIVREVLYIYQYVETKDFMMNRRRIWKLRQKFDFKPLTALGSASLYKLIRFSKRVMFSYLKKPPCQIGEESTDSGSVERNGDMKTELVEVFEEIKKSFSDEEYHLKKMCSKASIESIYRVLSQDEVRAKLFSEDCGIYTVISEADNIRSIVIESRSRSASMPSYQASTCLDITTEIEEDFIIHSYFDVDTIIDVRFGKEKEVLMYRIMKMEENSYGYNSKVDLYYSKSMNLRFPNYFVEAFQLRIRQDEYLTIATKYPYSTSPVKKEFRKEVEIKKGAIYIEFYTDVPDDYSFTVYGHSGDLVYDIYKIITSRKVKIVLPVAKEKETFSIILVPKFNRNRNIHYKILSLPEQFSSEVLVDCNIGLSRNMKFYCPVVGKTDSVIFWEKGDDDKIKGYIENSDTKIMISRNGTMRTENREYNIYYKNKGEKKRDIRVFLGISLRKP
ncbi:hypothetical protein EROM_051370 [Encephalitozoon romaleae SJ-2008]|uniref:SMP-LTD domain-containing protein n=1 Tax=Encephalitozoon romaleae (strain SJ-2008) TaxID=1178016 RepID=I7ARR2_ENCRO|nr:hypothetical protein EROM_051370 [Encephalitozoon romaleae SJ-2008]AFN83067.1 hypothetical protein EROM_051370 [Encephalitozoon romaleae SJ-2008]